MSQSPNLLNEDGTASMATMLMMSHHASRRDIARFIQAVVEIKAGDSSRVDAVRDEWNTSYRQALHGHHTMEGTHIFPDIESTRPDLALAIAKLMEQHNEIDPLIEKGDVAFADLAHPDRAEVVLNELKRLLDEHLTFEEAEITPALRDKKDFPMPEDDKVVAMYAEGFSWSMQGIAPEVLDEVKKLLPDVLVAKLGDAQKEFEKRCERVWGTYKVTSSTTSVPRE